MAVISRVFVSEGGEQESESQERFEDASQTAGFEDEEGGDEPRNTSDLYKLERAKQGVIP